MVDGVFFLTGEVNSGKTSVLSGWWVDLYRGRGKRIGGVLAPANWKGGTKVSYDIVDLSTGERRLMASLKTIKDGERIGRFWFSRKGILLGNNAIKSLNADWDIGIVDEVGPLELEGSGLAKGFREMLEHPPKKLIVVVRNTLLEDVARSFGIRDFRCLSIESDPP